MTTVHDLTPADAILAVIDRMHSATTSTITGVLAGAGYRWVPRNTNGDAPYTRPTVDRVGAALRALEKRGLVERVRGQSPIRWRRPR